MQERLKTIILLICLLTGQIVLGQYSLSSPYSRYGIGSMDVPNNQVTSSMGAIGQAFARNNVINISNPASFSAIDTQSFVFDIGFQMGWKTVSTSQYSSDAFLADLTNISFGFPLSRNIKAAINLVPISKIGYRSSDTTMSDNDIEPSYIKIFRGNGELDKVSFGLAYQATKNPFLSRFSIGANLSYTFGNIYRSTTIRFVDTTGYLNDRNEINYNLSAFSLDLGLQYFQPFANGDKLGLGFTYTQPINYKTNNTTLYYTYYEYGNQDVIQDTLKFTKYNGKIIMPRTFAGGISYNRPNKLFVEADFSYNTWSEFKFQEDHESNLTKDNIKISMGTEYIPNIYGSYLEKFSYRLGFNYDNGFICINEKNRISKLGVNFGFSMPIKKLGTNLNFNFEYGRMGTHDNGLIRENYFRMGLSVSAKDRWFVQRKYK